MVSRVEEHLLQLEQNELAHLTKELHVHPGTDDEKLGIEFPMPTVEGLEGLNTEQKRIKTPNMIAPNKPPDQEVWQQAMAEPLPHPSEDTPKRPNPNAPPSSPYLPGKGPGSKDDKLAGGPSFNINEGANTRKIRGIRKLQEGGSAGEKENADKILDKITGPKLPLV